MHYLFSSMSIELYIFILICGILFSIYAVYDMKKKKSRHPMIWIFPVIILLCISFIMYKCAIELTTNTVFQNITDLMACISSVMFVISFIVTFILAYKNNYVDKEKLKKMKTPIIICLLIILICTLNVMFL